MSLAALAEVTSLRDGNVSRARELADQALALLPEPDAGRYDAFSARTDRLGHGDLDEYAPCRGAARSRPDARSPRPRERMPPPRQPRPTSLASSSTTPRSPWTGPAARTRERQRRHARRRPALAGLNHLQLGELDQAEGYSQEARELFAEAGKTWPLGRTVNDLAVLALAQDEPRAGGADPPRVVRLLKPIEDRGTLCESQRLLAQVLIMQGKLDEAERFALEAQETVGPQDATSLATTSLALAELRAAQDRDDEADELYTEALAQIKSTDFKRTELEILESYVPFLRDRRPADATPYEERLTELRPEPRRPGTRRPSRSPSSRPLSPTEIGERVLRLASARASRKPRDCP